MNFKELFITLIGAIGSAITTLLGGWTDGLITLVIFMSADFITGLLVAGVFKKSTKTQSGAINSFTMFKGIAKKFVMLVMVALATRIDLLLNCNYLRDMVVIALIVDELISLTENIGLMGVPIPTVFKKAIDILKEKSETEE